MQLTGRLNYTKMGAIFGVDLVDNPDLAAQPNIAAEIAVYGMIHGSFTGVSLSTYLNSNPPDFLDARRIINGMDQAATIAAMAEAFYNALFECSANASPSS